MFTLIWFPSESRRDPTFEPTLSLEREFGSSADLFLEYVGDYDHHRPTQVIDSGGAWRFTKTQQLDFHVGFGLNSSRLVTISASVIRSASTGYSQVQLVIPHDLTPMAKDFLDSNGQGFRCSAPPDIEPMLLFGRSIGGRLVWA
jgi:hypothetical protein